MHLEFFECFDSRHRELGNIRICPSIKIFFYARHLKVKETIHSPATIPSFEIWNLLFLRVSLAPLMESESRTPVIELLWKFLFHFIFSTISDTVSNPRIKIAKKHTKRTTQTIKRSIISAMTSTQNCKTKSKYFILFIKNDPPEGKESNHSKCIRSLLHICICCNSYKDDRKEEYESLDFGFS